MSDLEGQYFKRIQALEVERDQLRAEVKLLMQNLKEAKFHESDLFDQVDHWKSVAEKLGEALEYSCEHGSLKCDTTCERDIRDKALAQYNASRGDEGV